MAEYSFLMEPIIIHITNCTDAKLTYLRIIDIDKMINIDKITYDSQ